MGVLLVGALALAGQTSPVLTYIFTSDDHLQIVSNGSRRELVPGFTSTADAAVSFDGRRVLFAGKRNVGEPWRIWELALPAGTPRRITSETEQEDAIAPFYLPNDRIVYAQHTPAGYQLMRMALAGGDLQQLTYGPGDHITNAVLQDGRILFEAPHSSGVRDLYTVYPDGTGIETYRCDHGPDRRTATQLSSGDIVFQTGDRLARFTSALATQVDIEQPKGEIAGPIAEVGPSDWLVSLRSDPSAPYALHRWRGGALTQLAKQGGHPVLVRPHPAPKAFPSAIRERPGANLLCLNVYTSHTPIPEGSVASVRVWGLDESNEPTLLGQTPVARDGSFYVQAPGERSIRFELIDRAGKTVAEEKGWFWARRGEQRVCVGCHAGPERAPDNAVPEILLNSQEPVVMMPVHAKGGK